MNNLAEVLELAPLFLRANVPFEGRNFEHLFSELAGRRECHAILSEIEKRVHEYFANMELPDQPTLY